MSRDQVKEAKGPADRRGRLSLDNFPLELAHKSSKAFPDGPKGRKRAIITLMALSLDPELPDEIRRFLTRWGYDAEQYPAQMNPRGLYRKLLQAIEEAKVEDR